VTASHVSDPALHDPVTAGMHDDVTIKNQPSKVITSHDNLTNLKETSLSRVVLPRGGESTLDELDYIPAPTYLAPTPQIPYSKSVSSSSHSVSVSSQLESSSNMKVVPSDYLLSPDAKNEEERARFEKSQIEHDPQMLKFMEQYPEQKATIQQLINFRGQQPSATILTSAFLMVETLSYKKIKRNVIQIICEYALNGTTVGELCLSQFKARLEMYKHINSNVYLWGNANFNAFLTIVQECKKQGSTNVAPTPITKLPRDIALMVKYMRCPNLRPPKGLW
jgi:hypothetical protein